MDCCELYKVERGSRTHQKVGGFRHSSRSKEVFLIVGCWSFFRTEVVICSSLRCQFTGWMPKHLPVLGSEDCSWRASKFSSCFGQITYEVEEAKQLRELEAWSGFYESWCNSTSLNYCLVEGAPINLVKISLLLHLSDYLVDDNKLLWFVMRVRHTLYI